MDSQYSDILEKFKENLFRIIYLILLIALLALIVSNEEKVESDAQSKKQNEQLVRDN